MPAMFGWLSAAAAAALLHQTPELFVGADALAGQPFERNGSAEPRVFGEKDFTHAARTDLLEHAVRTDHCVRRQRVSSQPTSA
jgi:hypothetical protein